MLRGQCRPKTLYFHLWQATFTAKGFFGGEGVGVTVDRAPFVSVVEMHINIIV